MRVEGISFSFLLRCPELESQGANRVDRPFATLVGVEAGIKPTSSVPIGRLALMYSRCLRVLGSDRLAASTYDVSSDQGLEIGRAHV